MALIRILNLFIFAFSCRFSVLDELVALLYISNLVFLTILHIICYTWDSSFSLRVKIKESKNSTLFRVYDLQTIELYTVTRIDVIFRYPDRVPLTHFVHRVKKVFSMGAWILCWVFCATGIFRRCNGKMFEHRGGVNLLPSDYDPSVLPLRHCSLVYILEKTHNSCLNLTSLTPRFGGLLSRLEKKPACKGRSLETFLTYPMHQVRIAFLLSLSLL